MVALCVSENGRYILRRVFSKHFSAVSAPIFSKLRHAYDVSLSAIENAPLHFA